MTGPVPPVTAPEDGVWYRAEPGAAGAPGAVESTAAVGRAVLAAAARAAGAHDQARAVEEERDWRHRYARHFRDVVVAVAASGADVAAAAAALRTATEHFPLRPPRTMGGHEPSSPRPPATASFVGEGRPEETLSLPWRGDRLRGDQLLRQLQQWQAAGILEPSAARAVRAVVDHPEWLDLGDLDVLVVGAAAELAPTLALLRWGARVTAVDVPVPALWQHLIEAAAPLAGSLTVPLDPAADSEQLGLDVRRWPEDVAALGVGLARRPVLGNYVYADGRAFPPLQQAVDRAWLGLRERREDAALATLATPTDVFLVPPQAVAEARARFAQRGWRRVAQAPLRAATAPLPSARLFAPAYGRSVEVPDGRTLGVADCLVIQQGPNYALAKQLQRWRALTAMVEGSTVSVNVAPPTRTRSVLRNRVLAAAYTGAGRFGVEVFPPATSSTLMAALLVHDLRAPRPTLRHAQDLFSNGAVHGGLWRVSYAPRSVLGLAVGAGLLARR